MLRFSLLVLFLFCMGCHSKPQTAVSRDLQHVVMIWLKDKSDENRLKVMEASKILYEIDELKAMTMGKAVPSDRSIVDDSFDIGYVMHFRNKKEMDAYLVHPIHVKLVKEVLKPSMEKVLVYDIISK